MAAFALPTVALKALTTAAKPRITAIGVFTYVWVTCTSGLGDAARAALSLKPTFSNQEA